MDANEASVRRLALVVLGVVMVAIVAGLVVVAVATRRELDSAGKSVLLGLALIALVGGAVLLWGPLRGGARNGPT